MDLTIQESKGLGWYVMLSFLVGICQLIQEGRHVLVMVNTQAFPDAVSGRFYTSYGDG